MKKSLFTIRTFIKINTRRFFRDRLAIFFTVIFPLIFLLIFGAMSRGSGNSFDVALINNSSSEFAKQFVEQSKDSKTIKVDQSITSWDVANQKLERSEIDAIIELPAGFGDVVSGTSAVGGQAKVIYSENNAQTGQTLVSVLDGIFLNVNKDITKQAPPFTVVGQSTGDKSLSRFDYTFAGLLGFSIIGLGIFGPVNVFPELKKQGVLRRFHTTPLTVSQYFVSNVVSQAAIGLLTLSISFIVAILVFKLRVVGNWFELAAFIVMGISCIYGIGLAIGGWAKNERQAAPLSNLVVFPMMFLSGTFFPRFLMPEWLQNISFYIPLTPIIDGIRMIATEGKGLMDLGPQIGVIAVWTVVIYFVAFRVFRWE